MCAFVLNQHRPNGCFNCVTDAVPYHDVLTNYARDILCLVGSGPHRGVQCKDRSRLMGMKSVNSDLLLLFQLIIQQWLVFSMMAATNIYIPNAGHVCEPLLCPEGEFSPKIAVSIFARNTFAHLSRRTITIRVIYVYVYITSLASLPKSQRFCSRRNRIALLGLVEICI